MKRDKYTKNPAETSVEVAVPVGLNVRIQMVVEVPIPRLHIAPRAGMPDLLTIHPAPGNAEIDFDVEIRATGTSYGTADVEVRAWYADTGEPVPNDVLDEPEWMNPIERAATEYLRDWYESNCDPDEWIRGGL